MPETIASALVTEKNKVHNVTPWVWLFEVQVDATQAMRVAGHHSSVTHGGNSYVPFPIAVGPQSRDARGVLQQVEVVVSNLSREVVGYLEASKLLDQQVTIRLVHASNPANKVHESTYSILEATVTSKAATFLLGPYGLLKATFPAQRFMRTRCRWEYGLAGCAYDTTMPNLVAATYPNFDPSTCDLGLGTDNGCRVHGHNEVANGRPRLHPLRFGGFPGIPKGPARI